MEWNGKKTWFDLTWFIPWLHWEVEGCEWIRVCVQRTAVTAAAVTYKLKTNHTGAEINSQQYFVVKVVFFGTISPTCSLCVARFFWCKTPEIQQSPVHAPVPAARRTALWIKPPEHRCDESTYSAARRQTLHLWSLPCAVYRLPDFNLHIRS